MQITYINTDDKVETTPHDMVARYEELMLAQDEKPVMPYSVILHNIENNNYDNSWQLRDIPKTGPMDREQMKVWLTEVIELEKTIRSSTGLDLDKALRAYSRKRGPLTQGDMDEYIRLSKAYLGGPNIPLEIQLAAFDKAGEEPTGIELDSELVGDMSVVEYLRLIIPLRDRKKEFGVEKGVDDPEKDLEVKQRAVIIYTRCALEIAESEVKNETNPRMVYFPTPAGAKLGRNGYIPLFPNYNDSPVGKFRGDGAAFNAMDCVTFIGKHFPDVEDEILNSLADA